MPIWLNDLFDHGITAQNAEVIWRTLAYLVGGFLVTSAAGVVIDISVSTLGPKTLNDVRTNVFDKLLSLRSEEHTSELQSLMRISYAVFCLKKKIEKQNIINTTCQKR